MSEFSQFILSLDQRLFLFINVELANPLFDFIMPFITNKKNWYIPIGISWILLLWKGGRKGRIIALLIVPVLILSDQASSSWIKPLFSRLRPCKTLEHIRLLVHCGSGYSFPSAHATNISAAFTIFIYFYRKYSAIWITIILLIGLSRISVGVHYPLDVLGGYLIGASISILAIIVFNFGEGKVREFINDKKAIPGN